MESNNIHLFEFNGKKYAYLNNAYIVISLNDLSYKVFQQHNKYEDLNIDELKSFNFNIDRINKIKEVYNKLKNYGIFNCNYTNLDFLNKNLKNQIYNTATIFLTDKCNLKCIYCYEDSNGHTFIDKKVITKTLEFLKENSYDKKININLFGGEPLLSIDLIKFLLNESSRLGIKNRVNYSITTNGTIMNNEIFNILKENNISIALSLDGNKSQQNINRPFKNGSSSFEVIDKNIENYFKKLKEKIVVKSTITKNNKNLKDIYNQVEKYDFDVSIINLAITNDENIKLSDLEFEDIVKISTLIANDYVYKVINNIKCPAPSFITMWLTQMYPNLRRNSYCGINDNAIAIDTYGNIYACHRFVGMKNMILGNIISNDSLKLNDKREKYLIQNENCENCWCKNICNGGCAHENYIFNNPKDFNFICLLRQKWIEISLGVYAEICNSNPKALINIVGEDIFSKEVNRFIALDKI